MRYLRHVWDVFLALVQIAVVLALLYATKTKFETMVMGGLILIYTAVVGAWQALGRTLLHMGHKQLEFFVLVGTLLNQPNLDIYSKALKDEAEETEQRQAKYWISVAANGLISVIGALALHVSV